MIGPGDLRQGGECIGSWTTAVMRCALLLMASRYGRQLFFMVGTMRSSTCFKRKTENERKVCAPAFSLPQKLGLSRIFYQAK